MPNAQPTPFSLQGRAQLPVAALQTPEQQVPGAAGHALPVAVQVGAGAQALVGVPVQMPVQHSAPVPQAVPFCRQGLAQ